MVQSHLPPVLGGTKAEGPCLPLTASRRGQGCARLFHRKEIKGGICEILKGHDLPQGSLAHASILICSFCLKAEVFKRLGRGKNKINIFRFSLNALTISSNAAPWTLSHGSGSASETAGTFSRCLQADLLFELGLPSAAAPVVTLHTRTHALRLNGEMPLCHLCRQGIETGMLGLSSSLMVTSTAVSSRTHHAGSLYN